MTQQSTILVNRLPTANATDVSTGTSTTPKIMSPANVKDMIANFATSASTTTIASARAKTFFFS